MWGPGQTPDPAATGTSPAFQPFPMVKTVLRTHAVLLAIPERRPDLRTKKGKAVLFSPGLSRAIVVQGQSGLHETPRPWGHPG